MSVRKYLATYKATLACLHFSTMPKLGEELYLYLVVSPIAINSILVKKDRRFRKPIYYINKILSDAKTRYSRLKKMTFALVTLVRKVHPYFQAHMVVLLMDQPLKTMLIGHLRSDS